MSKTIVDVTKLAPEARAEFQRMTRAPKISWPTVILWVVLMLTYGCTYYYCGTRQWPLWLGFVLNSVVGYVAFSIVHDAIHRSISTHTWLNDFFGQTAVMVGQPNVDLRMFRWTHILHHRFAVGERDPDTVLRGAWWTLPFRWMFIDLLYFVHALKHGDKVSKPYLRSSLILTAIMAAAFTYLVILGYGMELLFLWFLPSRIVQLVLGFSFFWLPHVPHDVTQEQNFTRATTVRVGHEWLLGPLLQYQHYHLIHHLYPSTPFYNNYKVWQLIELQLRKKDLAVQHGLAIRPTIYPAPAV